MLHIFIKFSKCLLLFDVVSVAFCFAPSSGLSSVVKPEEVAGVDLTGVARGSAMVKE